MLKRAMAVIGLVLSTAACSRDAVVMGADGLPLTIPSEYLSGDEHSWWVDAAEGMDKPEGLVLNVPTALLPRVRNMPGMMDSFIMLVKAKADGQEEHTRQNIAKEYHWKATIMSGASADAKAQRVYYSENIKNSWMLFTRSSGDLAMAGRDLVQEVWLGPCSDDRLAGISCASNVYVGPFEVAFDGSEELLVRHDELEKDLKELFCSWTAKKGESREWCK